ncbi:hypothetical protein LAD59_08535 [Klebsiella pneumoniae]|nr:hypothetical protein [Klebsiella pneumoniae]
MAAFFARTDDSLAEESAHFLSFLLNLFPKSQILWRLMADLSFRNAPAGTGQRSGERRATLQVFNDLMESA